MPIQQNAYSHGKTFHPATAKREPSAPSPPNFLENFVQHLMTQPRGQRVEPKQHLESRVLDTQYSTVFPSCSII